MGLLNFLQSGWGMQQPQGFMPGEWDWMNQTQQWGQWPGQQQMQFPGMPQQQQRPAQFPQARAPAQMPQPDENGISGPMPSMVSQVGTATPPPVKPPGFGDRLQGFMDPNNQRGLFGPGMQMAMSLLGNGSNGGDWSRVGQDMRGIQQNQAQMANQRFQQFVAGRQMQRQEQQWGREDQQRAALDEWVKTLPAEDQALAKARPDLAYQAFMEQHMAANAPITPFQERSLALQEKQIAATGAANGGRYNIDRYLAARDAERMAEDIDVSQRLQTVGLPALQNLKNTVIKAGQQRLAGLPIDARDRIKLGQIFNGSSAERATLEVWRAQVLTPALETMRGLGAMSQKEFEEALNAFANPNMTYGAAMRLVDQKLSEAQRRISAATVTNEFYRDAGGITGARNKVGEDYTAYFDRRMKEMGLGVPDSWDKSEPAAKFPNPTPGDVDMLRKDASAARRKQFDEVYGPGAAARVLRGGGGKGQEDINARFRAALGGP